MIRNKIDGQDVPMKLEHVGGCALLGREPWRGCTCWPPYPRLVVDVRQQRLEHDRCPDCPTHLKGGRGQKRGWKGCSCCGRSWRVRPNGYFEEQLPLDTEGCGHFTLSVAEHLPESLGDH